MMVLGSALAAKAMVGVLLGALLLLLWGHQSPLPLRRGMSEDEVEGLLGRPGRRTRAERSATWVYADTVVNFRSGRVARIRFQ